MPMVNIALFGAIQDLSDIAPPEMLMEVLGEVAKRGDYRAYEEAAREGFGGVKRVGVSAPVT